MNSTSLSELARQITAFIGQTTAKASLSESVRSDFQPNFDRLARELFAAQYQANEAYRRFSDSVGVSPDKVNRWAQIPFVPTSGFKDSELTSLPPADRPRVFFSSATTGQSRSRHFHNAESLALYEAALKPWLYRYLVQPMAELEEGEGRTAVDRPGILSLTPPASAAPNSSLVHMLDVAVQEFAARDSVFAGLIGPESVWQIDYDRVLFALRKSMCANRPLLITGTAFNFVELLDFLESRNIRYRLAEGSRVMETGGYKG
ncbi:MAG TPA: hypothetical protein VMF06_19385, partial [Candidatus Limnocylindria bacterium]|nr:hypothetical protein [Candidatus Limnocylindria bacterium]